MLTLFLMAAVYLKLPYAGDVPREHPRDKPAREVLVVVDPGHGGTNDLGAVSASGRFEKDVNLLLALDVRTALEKLGYRVEMTRTNDCELVLVDRPRRAHAEKADAFIAIHHNAPPIGRDPMDFRYQCVYAWNPLGLALARRIVFRMEEARRDLLPSKGVLQANYAVTRSPEIPSVLIEADYITHPAGEASAWDPAERRRLAAAIAAGFADWCCGR